MATAKSPYRRPAMGAPASSPYRRHACQQGLPSISVSVTAGSSVTVSCSASCGANALAHSRGSPAAPVSPWETRPASSRWASKAVRASSGVSSITATSEDSGSTLPTSFDGGRLPAAAGEQETEQEQARQFLHLRSFQWAAPVRSAIRSAPRRAHTPGRASMIFLQA